MWLKGTAVKSFVSSVLGPACFWGYVFSSYKGDTWMAIGVLVVIVSHAMQMWVWGCTNGIVLSQMGAQGNCNLFWGVREYAFELVPEINADKLLCRILLDNNKLLISWAISWAISCGVVQSVTDDSYTHVKEISNCFCKQYSFALHHRRCI